MVVFELLAGAVITTAAGGEPRLTVIDVAVVVPNALVQEAPIEFEPETSVTEAVVAAPAFCVDDVLLVVLLTVQVVLAGTVLLPPTV